MKLPLPFLVGALLAAPVFFTGCSSGDAVSQKSSTEITSAKDQHGGIGVKEVEGDLEHTTHPDAQWFPDAGMGLFIHWGISSELSKDISWPMITGGGLKNKRIEDPKERERMIRERDFNLTGKPQELTPNKYWKAAETFNPQAYDPEKWILAAKQAGFTYAVLTTRHHDGFAMWPSAFGDFNTKNHMGGRDLVKPFVDACRKHGVKVGLYYSPPNWHFDRDYFNFLYWRSAEKNPEIPTLDADLNPRTRAPSAQEVAEHRKKYAALVRGQVEELLTRYGKVDMLWFDGVVPGTPGDACITQARIREMQPGILINPRLHGTGDFKTFEGSMSVPQGPEKGWAEYCYTWGPHWAYAPGPYKSTAHILGLLAKSRALHVNFLPDVGPRKDGTLPEDAYKGMKEIAGWMEKNRESVYTVSPLPEGEKSSVPATSVKGARYLYVIPEFKNNGIYDKDRLPNKDRTLTLTGTAKPVAVRILGDDRPVAFSHDGKNLVVEVPADRQGELVTVVKVEL